MGKQKKKTSKPLDLGSRILSGIFSALCFTGVGFSIKWLIENHMWKQTYLLTGYEQFLAGVFTLIAIWGFIGGMFFAYAALSKD